MTRYILGDLRTGNRILDLPVIAGPWESRIDTAETISVTIDMQNPDAQLLNLRNTAAASKTFLAVVEGVADGEFITAAGPIWTHAYDRDTASLQLGAKGMWSLFNHRLILPLLAGTLPITAWTVPDPADNTKTIPNPNLTTSYTGQWLGTIAKRLVAQAVSWTGGGLPIVLPSEETSTNADHDREYIGADFKSVGEAIQELSQVDGGPEIQFVPQFKPGKLGVQWVMRVGSAAQPLLFGNTQPRWDLTVKESPMSGFHIDQDATGMGSLSWATGGRSSDDVLVSRAYNSTLVDLGYPLMEVLDSSHSSVSKQSTLDGYAAQNLMNAQQPSETWSFTVESYPSDVDGNPAGPQLGSFAVGDFCQINLAGFQPATETQAMVGDPYLQQAGPYLNRITGMTGDETGLSVQLTTQPEVY